MAYTNSFSFPYMLNPIQNRVTLYQDNKAITNRTRLLMLTGKGELYNEPDFGLGLQKYMYKYNGEGNKPFAENQVAILQSDLQDQLDKYEPYVKSGESTVERNDDAEQDVLDVTVKLRTTYLQNIQIPLESDL